MTEHRFRAELWQHSPREPGSFFFLTVPPETGEDLAVEAGPRKGFGSVRVQVRIGDTVWRTSLFPDAVQGTFVLPVKKAVRQAVGLAPGAWCDVTLTLIES